MKHESGRLPASAVFCLLLMSNEEICSLENMGSIPMPCRKICTVSKNSGEMTLLPKTNPPKTLCLWINLWWSQHILWQRHLFWLCISPVLLPFLRSTCPQFILKCKYPLLSISYLFILLFPVHRFLSIENMAPYWKSLMPLKQLTFSDHFW